MVFREGKIISSHPRLLPSTLSFLGVFPRPLVKRRRHAVTCAATQLDFAISQCSSCSCKRPLKNVLSSSSKFPLLPRRPPFRRRPPTPLRQRPPKRPISPCGPYCCAFHNSPAPEAIARLAASPPTYQNWQPTPPTLLFFFSFSLFPSSEPTTHTKPPNHNHHHHHNVRAPETFCQAALAPLNRPLLTPSRNTTTIIPTLAAVANGDVQGTSPAEREMAVATVAVALAAVGRVEACAGGAERIVGGAAALVAAIQRALYQTVGQEAMVRNPLAAPASLPPFFRIRHIFTPLPSHVFLTCPY
ncbi:hypothetical protein F5X68DRAFT_40672 [Plectosphaerella plurivora]|uniref:Uncharacterized protein n=1 Tax=Plectosphaerella plurivora TaxID=936078 RepID=A0A9P8V4V9_9PEZI|nr:hypothetical protein F5X68DRAFT_40672 [Plectosphaerella plurivora]